MEQQRSAYLNSETVRSAGLIVGPYSYVGAALFYKNSLMKANHLFR